MFLGTTTAVLTRSPVAAAAMQAAIVVLLVTTSGSLAPPPPAYLDWVYQASYVGYSAAQACSRSPQVAVAPSPRPGRQRSARPPGLPLRSAQHALPPLPCLPFDAVAYAPLAKNEFAGLTLIAADGTPVTLSGPPPADTPHAGWSLGAVMGMLAGQWVALWAVMGLAMALAAHLRRL